MLTRSKTESPTKQFCRFTWVKDFVHFPVCCKKFMNLYQNHNQLDRISLFYWVYGYRSLLERRRITTNIYQFKGLFGTNTPGWLVSSVVWALHQYRRDHGFKSRTGLNFFFRPYFHYCSSSVHYCEDRFHIHVFIRSSNMWLSYIHCRLCKSILYTKEGNTMWHIIIL